MMAADMNSNPRGVYKNPRLMHACTSIVGYTVHLQTKEGIVWEGIFKTFSPEFTICLQLAIQIDPKLSSKDWLYAALKSGLQAKQQAFFDLKDIVRISAVDVDLNYATKELSKLTTDADISGYDANKSAEHRQLESWQDDDCENANSESLMSLDDVALASGKKNDSKNSSRGWDAQDMFRYNENVHKVKTTYDEKLTEYTLPLPKHSTKDWRKKQERAAAIAKEIESNTKSQSRLAKEDEGDCEEEKFSAVIRPIPQPPPSRPQTQPDNKFYNVETTESGKQNQNQQSQQQSHQQSQPSQGQQQSQQQQQSQPNQRHQQMHQHHQQTSRTFRPRPQDRSQVESLKNFGKQLNLGPPNAGTGTSPGNINTSSNTGSSSSAATIATSVSPNSSSSASTATGSGNETVPVSGSTSVTSTTGSSSVSGSVSSSSNVTGSSTGTPTTSNSSGVSTTKDQSELARKSKLNPNAKEFVYKPRSPAVNQGAPIRGPNQAANSGFNQAANGGPNHAANSGAIIDPNNSSPMVQATHAPYYQQVTMFPHGLSHHQQQHHAQFMSNHAHPHFQNQIHYMSPMPPQFAQQMPRGYIRGNFQNYHHRGEHHGNVRADYTQASMMAPTSAGQQFVAPPSGAPHPMNAYPASPQQPMIYSGPHQSMYPVVQAGFPQHMPHMMPNPPPYDGSTVYMPPQNYIVNP